jgi:hypothetical protein
MATRNYTITKTSNPLVWVVSWTGLLGAGTDVGQAFDVTTVPGAGGADRSVHFVSGAWNGTTAVLQGSNDGTNFLTLADPQGTALSATSDDIETVLEYTRSVRPSVSAGTGSIACYLVVRGSR